MKRLFCLALVFALAACGSEPTPSSPNAAAAPSADQPADPAPSTSDAPKDPPKPGEISAADLEKITEEVRAVQALLLEKHPEIASALIQINKVDVGSTALFEIVTVQDNQTMIFYTDAPVNYVLVGTLFVGQGQEVVNLTAQRQELLMPKEPEDDGVSGRAVFEALPLNAGLTYNFGTPTRTFVAFEDPDCGFCQQFHKDLAVSGDELNARLVIFPFVLESQHPRGVERAKSLLCAAEPAKAWNDWMMAAAGKTNEERDQLWSTWSPTNAPVSDCPEAGLVDMWQNLGKQLGLSATPTLMFENGSMAEGLPSRQDLLASLDMAAEDVKKNPSPQPAPAAQN